MSKFALFLVLVLMIPVFAMADETSKTEDPVSQEEKFNPELFVMEGKTLLLSYNLAAEQITRINAQIQFLSSELNQAKQRQAIVVEQIKEYNKTAEENDQEPIKLK